MNCPDCGEPLSLEEVVTSPTTSPLYDDLIEMAYYCDCGFYQGEGDYEPILETD